MNVQPVKRPRENTVDNSDYERKGTVFLFLASD